MKIHCPSCNAKYSIADDKVRGKRVKVRCKTCGQPIQVDGTQLDDDDAGLDDHDEDGATQIMQSPFAARGPAGIPRPGAAPAAAAGPAPWSVNLTDEDSRTLTTAEVVALWQSGGLPDDAYAWRDDLPDWLPVMDIPELAAAIQAAQAAAPPPDLFGGAAAGAARVSPRASQSDLFAEADDDEPAAPPPAMASRPGMGAYDDKPSGARNENSVLFTLDALKPGGAAKAGAAAPRAALAPKGSGPRPPRREGPAPDTSLDDLMSVSAAPVQFSATSMTDLLAAAPPPPPVVEAPAASQAASAQAAPGEGKKRTLLIGLGVAAVFALGVGSTLALSSGKGEGGGTAPTASAAPAPTAPPATATATAPATTVAAAPEPTATATAAPSATAATEPSAPTAEAAKPTSGTAGAAAPAPGPLPKPGDSKPGAAATTAAPAGGALPPFNKSAAIAALGAAAGSAGSCKRPDGPTGSGKATVTFAPSGRAVSASVSGGSFGGTAVGGCVASVFRRAKVPPFSGDSVTVSKSFSIN